MKQAAEIDKNIRDAVAAILYHKYGYSKERCEDAVNNDLYRMRDSMEDFHGHTVEQLAAKMVGLHRALFAHKFVTEPRPLGIIKGNR